MPVLHMMSVRRPSSLPTRTQVPRPLSMPMPGSPDDPLVNQAADDRRLPDFLYAEATQGGVCRWRAEENGRDGVGHPSFH